MLLAGAALTAATDVVRLISVVDAKKVSVTTSTTLGAASITRAAGDWNGDGFKLGMEIWISGLPGSWTINSITATTLGLTGAAIVPAGLRDAHRLRLRPVARRPGARWAATTCTSART